MILCKYLESKQGGRLLKKHSKFLRILFIFTMIFPSITLNVLAQEAATAKRLAGNARVETSIKISQEAYEQADNVVLAGYSGEADALTGTLIASAKDATLLLVDHFKNIETELKRLNAKNIYLLDGSSVISDQVEKDLLAAKYQVVRLAGSDRYETAAKVATKSITKTNHVFLTNDGRSGSLADALAAGPV